MEATMVIWSKEDEELFLGEQWTPEQVEQMKSRNLLARYAANESLAEDELRFMRQTTKCGAFIEASVARHKAGVA